MSWNPYLDEAEPLLSDLNSFRVRQSLVKKYAWAIPNEEALQTLVKYAPIVEIGAGTGYWARCLRERGVDIKAYDKKPYSNTYADNQWTAVSVGRARKAKQFSDHTLFLCWPPYASSLAYDCLRLYRGKTLVFVGESNGGCTGDDAFFDLLDKNYTCKEVVHLPNWFGLHDYLCVYVRN